MPDTVSLSDATNQFRIEYSLPAMEQIRARARDGLMAVPRVGMGVGGLLLGERDGRSLRLLDSIEIPCSHSSGPSFHLSPEEKAWALAALTEASSRAAGSPVVIGWYCSKTRGDAVPNPADLTLHQELFPEPGPVALILRPSPVDPMQAAFYSREKGGELSKTIECLVDEWRPPVEPAALEPESEPAPPVAAEMEPAPPPVTAPEPKKIPLPQPPPPQAPPPEPPPVTKLADIIELSAMDRGRLFGIPLAADPLPPRPKRRVLLFGTLGAAAALLLGAAAFFTQDLWMPKPPLALTSSETNGDLLIRWNPDAVRRIDHATMFVNDGGPLQSLPLDAFQLHSGMLTYKVKSQRVTAKLDAGETSGITVWFAPENPPANPATPPKP